MISAEIVNCQLAAFRYESNTRGQNNSCNTDCDCPLCKPYCSHAGFCQFDDKHGRRLIKEKECERGKTREKFMFRCFIWLETRLASLTLCIQVSMVSMLFYCHCQPQFPRSWLALEGWGQMGGAGLGSLLRMGHPVNVTQTQPTSAAPPLATAATRRRTAPVTHASTTIPQEVSRVDSDVSIQYQYSISRK